MNTETLAGLIVYHAKMLFGTNQCNDLTQYTTLLSATLSNAYCPKNLYIQIRGWDCFPWWDIYKSQGGQVIILYTVN